jgi:hypothetical protein
MPDGTVRFEEHRGWIHVTTHELRSTDAVVAFAAPILDGHAFVFRESCQGCEPKQRDNLVVIFPRDPFSDELFQVERLSLSPGSAAHTEAAVPPWRLEPFLRLVGSQPDTAPAKPGEGRGAFLRVDASRGVSETAPRVVASRSACRVEAFDDCR